MSLITIYSAKGSAGKTPIAANIAFQYGFAIGTNEPYHLYNEYFHENAIISIGLEKEFPDIRKEFGDIDVVFDLAGSVSKVSYSITSAVNQSDVVVVPIYDEVKSIYAGMKTINDVMKMNKNIVVVATKLTKHRKDDFKNDWTKSIAFKNIEAQIRGNETLKKYNIPILPLKHSLAFDHIFEKGMSIQQMMDADPLSKFSYQLVQKQFDDLMDVINKYDG